MHSKTGSEWKGKKGCALDIIKASCALNILARQQSLCLGGALRGAGFFPSRANPGLWTKKSKNHTGCDCIVTFVGDLIVVAAEPLQCLEMLAKKLNLRSAADEPDFFFGPNWINSSNNARESSKKRAKEHARKFELECGLTRLENVLVPTKPSPLRHPEVDQSPLLDLECATIFQSILGACQWLHTSGRMGATFALASLSRLMVPPRENCLTASVKILGSLKKHPKKGRGIF